MEESYTSAASKEHTKAYRAHMKKTLLRREKTKVRALCSCMYMCMYIFAYMSLSWLIASSALTRSSQAALQSISIVKCLIESIEQDGIVEAEEKTRKSISLKVAACFRPTYSVPFRPFCFNFCYHIFLKFYFMLTLRNFYCLSHAVFLRCRASSRR